MTDAILKARLSEATRQYQSALEVGRSIKQVAEMRYTPIEAAPLIEAVDAEIEVHRERMNTAWEMAR